MYNLYNRHDGFWWARWAVWGSASSAVSRIINAASPFPVTTICTGGHFWKVKKKSRNGDTLGPVELIVWLEQGNQGDWREQDDQGEVYIIIFEMT